MCEFSVVFDDHTYMPE